MLDIQNYYRKLAGNETISEDEIVALLKELAHFRGSLSYLASCQAATLEGLPKSASKSTRARHVNLCEAAAAMLEGDSARLKFPERLESARDRCRDAAKKHCG